MSHKLKNGRGRVCDISSAVASDIYDGFAEGNLEQIKERIDRLADIVGRFLEAVTVKGTITAAEAAEIVGYNWQMAPDEAEDEARWSAARGRKMRE